VRQWVAVFKRQISGVPPPKRLERLSQLRLSRVLGFVSGPQRSGLKVEIFPK